MSGLPIKRIKIYIIRGPDVVFEVDICGTAESKRME